MVIILREEDEALAVVRWVRARRCDPLPPRLLPLELADEPPVLQRDEPAVEELGGRLLELEALRGDVGQLRIELDEEEDAIERQRRVRLQREEEGVEAREAVTPGERGDLALLRDEDAHQ